MRDGRSATYPARVGLAVLLSLTALASCSSIAPGVENTGSIHDIGTRSRIQDLAAWNIDVAPDGRGLPAAAATSHRRARIAAKCARATARRGRAVSADPLSAAWAR